MPGTIGAMEGRPGDQRGFIHKKLFRGIKGAVGAIGSGSPLGVAAGFASGFTSGGRRRIPAPFVTRVRQPLIPLQIPATAGGRISRRSTGIRLPGGVFIGREATTIGAQVDTQRRTAIAPPRGDGVCPDDGCCKGERRNKSSYFLIDGTFVEKGSKCVKIRRRDNLNGRAALNSTRRLVGWSKASRGVQRAIRAAARR